MCETLRAPDEVSGARLLPPSLFPQDCRSRGQLYGGPARLLVKDWKEEACYGKYHIPAGTAVIIAHCSDDLAAAHYRLALAVPIT